MASPSSGSSGIAWLPSPALRRENLRGKVVAVTGTGRKGKRVHPLGGKGFRIDAGGGRLWMGRDRGVKGGRAQQVTSTWQVGPATFMPPDFGQLCLVAVVFWFISSVVWVASRRVRGLQGEFPWEAGRGMCGTMMRNVAPEQPKMQVKRLSEHAVLPQRGSAGAAGYDLVSAYDCVIPSRSNAVVKTDLSIAIPEDCYARIAPRSGLAVKHQIDTGAGVVDSDYRGNVGVVLFNHGSQDFAIKRGDRVAQMILERIYTPEIVEVNELDATVRSDGGFGSTGKRKLPQE